MTPQTITKRPIEPQLETPLCIVNLCRVKIILLGAWLGEEKIYWDN